MFRSNPQSMRAGFGRLPDRPAALLMPLLALTVLASAGVAQVAPEQVRFSIDRRSPTNGELDTFNGLGITEGDVLVPATATGGPAYGPLPNPGILIRSIPSALLPSLGLHGSTTCAAPVGVPCGVEVDALSFGADYRIDPGSLAAGTYVFSVDLCSQGAPGSPLFPNVLSEAPAMDHMTDVFEDLGLPPPPLAPFPMIAAAGNSGIIDGDGLTSPTGALYPGLGLFEPGMLTVIGDELDALDLDPPSNALFPVYFSLDGDLLEPCWNQQGSNSAAIHGFSPADVLVTMLPDGPPQIYAYASQLGLGITFVPADDLDALAIAENGIPGYQPSQVPFDWLPSSTTAPTDMLLFSVRRGSIVVGITDSIFGIQIEPGDILTTPLAGGQSQFPGIFIAAEWLGLRTSRGAPWDAPRPDLDALDTRERPQTALPYCFGTATNCPCANGGAPGHGCANSVFADGGLLTASGRASVSNDTVSLLATSVTSNSQLFFQGETQIEAPLADGLICAGGFLIRLGVSNPYPGPGQLPVSVRGAIPSAGATRSYQCWYRNAAPFCTPATANLTHAVVIVWTP